MLDGQEAGKRHLTPVKTRNSDDLTPIQYDAAYQRFGPGITVRLRRWGLSFHDAQDMFQDIFISFYTRYHETDVDTTAAVLNRITRNRFIDVARHNNRYLVSPLEQSYPTDSNGNQTPKPILTALRSGTTPEDETIAAEEINEVDLALGRLEDRYRAVLSLKLEGLPDKEIAKVLGISNGVVRKRLMLGRRIFRQKDEAKKRRNRIYEIQQILKDVHDLETYAKYSRELNELNSQP